MGNETEGASDTPPTAHTIERGGAYVKSPEIRLHALRTELDGIDRTLRDALAARMSVCHRIGEVKREHNIDVMQPGRVREVIAGARAHALAHGLSPDYLAALYELIIEETCRVEDDLVNGVTTAARDGVAHNGVARSGVSAAGGT